MFLEGTLSVFVAQSSCLTCGHVALTLYDLVSATFRVARTETPRTFIAVGTSRQGRVAALPSGSLSCGKTVLSCYAPSVRVFLTGDFGAILLLARSHIVVQQIGS